MSYIRKRAIEGIQVGETFCASRTLSDRDVVQFADISRDYNPVHFDKRFARVKGFDRCVSHGLLVAGLVTEIGGQLGWFASGMDFRFRKPVYAGDTITCHFTISAIDERGRARGEAVFKNQDQAIVLEGVVTGIIPGPEEKEVMHAMIAEGDPTNKMR